MRSSACGLLNDVVSSIWRILSPEEKSLICNSMVILLGGRIASQRCFSLCVTCSFSEC